MRCRRISASSASRMNADRVVFRVRVILSTTFRRRSSIVIWMVFTAVDSNVDIYTHHIPHQLVGTLMTPISAEVLRESVVLSCASWCQLQRAPLGKLLNLQANFEPTAELIMPGSRVRVPPF